MNIVLGIDIGGTKMEVCALEACDQFKPDIDKIIFRDRVPTQRELGYDHALKNLSNLIKSSLQKYNLDINLVKGIGIGLPGTVDPVSEKMIHGNSKIFENQNIKSDLLKALAYECTIRAANDANCFALAEVKLGVGKSYYQNEKNNSGMAIGVILGTGCGGGVIVNGKLLLGANGGGEIGHHILQRGGFSCYCGQSGCAEQYISGTGLEKIYEDLHGDKIKGHEIFENFQDCQKKSQALTTYKSYLLQFLINLTNVFDPDFFVLGGGVSRQDEIYKNLTEELQNQSFYPNNQVKVMKHELGDSSGVFGAALLVSS